MIPILVGLVLIAAALGALFGVFWLSERFLGDAFWGVLLFVFSPLLWVLAYAVGSAFLKWRGVGS